MHPDVRLLGGRYELTALIATGGMGQVWQGRDTLLGRDVAVKVLRSEYTGDPTFLTRFRGEARLAAGLVHPNIATLFDYGEVPAAGPLDEHLAYLVMELVRGESLSGLLYREYQLSPERTLDVLRQSAAGLAAAHAAGVVHRDVKPGNLLIGSDGCVKITDFGVAVSGSSVPLTQTGEVICTPHYLSPEQAGGARATPASDVYALGLIGWQCLTGRRVFDGESPLQVALMQLNATPDPLPDTVPQPVRELIGAAMVKDPQRRFPDGAAFRDAIDDVRAGRPFRRPEVATAQLATADAVTEPGVPIAEPAHRRRLLVPLLALLTVAAVVVGGLQLVRGPDSGEAAAGTTAPSTSSAAPATPSVQLVDLVSADYLGRPYTDVQAELTARGLVVTLRPLQTSDVPDGQVIAVDPVGALTPASPVTVTYAVAPPPAQVVVVTPEPAPAPVPVPDTTAQTSVDTGSSSGTGSTGTGDGNANAGGNGKSNGKGNGKSNGKGNNG
jgi:eukaryotic-like serine/threonine-protein kinase